MKLPVDVPAVMCTCGRKFPAGVCSISCCSTVAGMYPRIPPPSKARMKYLAIALVLSRVKRSTTSVLLQKLLGIAPVDLVLLVGGEAERLHAPDRLSRVEARRRLERHVRGVDDAIDAEEVVAASRRRRGAEQRGVRVEAL